MKELLGLTPRPRIVTACCGAGWNLIGSLMSTPGASAYLVGSYLPYDAEETAAFLGFKPEKFVSEETAIHLATEAFMRATLHAKAGDNPIGLGMTASIASIKEHRGAHGMNVACITGRNCLARSVVLEKNVGGEARTNDDMHCSDVAERFLLVGAEDHYSESFTEDAARIAFLSRPFFAPSHRGTIAKLATDAILFPGAFNPLHEGHKRIADAVFRQTGQPVVYAITADSPHKPALTFQEMARRAAKMRRENAVLFTEGDPLYIDKARRFAGRPFIIGADALGRMLNPNWGPAIEPMLEEFEALGTRILVAPRIVDGKSLQLSDFEDRMPVRYGQSTLVFEEINVEPSAWSSTDLRQCAEAT